MHFRQVKDAGVIELQYAVDQEEEIAAANVRKLDPETARMWSAGFISQKPFNCPFQQKGEWVDAILYAAYRNGLPLCKEIMGLTASIISIESSFRSDPAVADPSRGEDLSSQLDRTEKEFFQKYGAWLSIPPVPQLYQRYKDKYYPRLLQCRTEGEVEVVAEKLLTK